MKIVISGYYGFGNLGDEAILEVIIDLLKKFDSSIGITVLSANPVLTKRTYNVEAVLRNNILSIFSVLKSADVFISGGGGLIQDRTSFPSLFYYLFLIIISKLLRKKIIIFGQGIGPLMRFSSWLLFHFIANFADAITVRDEFSLFELEKAQIRKPRIFLTADLTFLLNSSPYNFSQKEKTKIGVCVRPFILKKQNKEEVKTSTMFSFFQQKSRELAVVLDKLKDELNADIDFIPFQIPYDFEEAKKIASFMRDAPNILINDLNPQEVLDYFNQFDIFIGERLHSLIFAAQAGVPFIGIAYDPKVESFCKIYNMPFINPKDLRAVDLEKTIKSIFIQKEEIQKKIFLKTKELRESAKINAVVLYDELKEIVEPFDNLISNVNNEKKIEVLGVNFDKIIPSEALDQAESFINDRSKSHFIFTPNPEIVLRTIKNRRFREIINSSDLVIPDGFGVILASRILGRSLTERVSGIDLMYKLLEKSDQKGYRFYLLGGRPGIAQEAAQNIIAKFHNVKCAGFFHGYFNEKRNTELIKTINESSSDILFVGMGSPRQEKWLMEHKNELKVPLCMAVGGSFDVISGRLKRSPMFLRRFGLEWTFRYFQEPRRIVRILHVPWFLYLVFKEKKRQKLKNNKLKIKIENDKLSISSKLPARPAGG